jgi:multiple sugar transport system permease protein
MGLASAAAWVLFAVVFVFTLLQLRMQQRWVHYD